ncbi:MAG: ClpXP protease specificity-enhancing factor [Acidiferrobacteraceae bacterium]
MKPLRPYLLRALYDWILDNGQTPHIVVDAAKEGVQVPPEYVHEGRITLNIHPAAVQGFRMSDTEVSFSGRFSGRALAVSVPVGAVLGAYSRETGHGMFFQDETFNDVPPGGSSPPEGSRPQKPDRKGPALRVIK